MGDKHDKWPDFLGTVALAYNATIHSSTGYSPHELFYSFGPTCPLDIMTDTPATDPAGDSDSYALQATERLRDAFAFMRVITGKQAQRMKKYYDASVKPKRFDDGAYVLLYSPKRKRGLYSKWHVTWIGPFYVKKRLNDSNYVVQRSPKCRPFIVHVDRLKPYHGELPVPPGTAGQVGTAGQSGAAVSLGPPGHGGTAGHDAAAAQPCPIVSVAGNERVKPRPLAQQQHEAAAGAARPQRIRRRPDDICDVYRCNIGTSQLYVVSLRTYRCRVTKTMSTAPRRVVVVTARRGDRLARRSRNAVSA